MQMQLHKRDRSPYWWVSFTDARGKRHRVSTKCKDKREANKAAASIVTQAEAAAPKGTELTLYACLESYRAKLELHGQVAERNAKMFRDKTVGKMASSAGRFFMDPLMPLHDLDTELLQALVEARLGEGNGPTTIAHELKNLRAAVAYAKGFKKRVPVIDNWRIPKLTQKTRYLSDTEWRALYDRLSPDRVIHQTPSNRKAFTIQPSARSRAMMQDAQDLLVCLTFCGGRWSEVASLSFDRVDLNANTILIWGNKTQKFRLAPLPVLLKAVVERRLAAKAEGQKLLFPGTGPNGAEVVRKQSSNAIARAIKDCGLNTPESIKQSGRCTVHSLRHTFASWLLQKGAGLADVQEALGHTTMDMTRRYAHLSTADSTAKLTGILSGL